MTTTVPVATSSMAMIRPATLTSPAWAAPLSPSSAPATAAQSPLTKSPTSPTGSTPGLRHRHRWSIAVARHSTTKIAPAVISSTAMMRPASIDLASKGDIVPAKLGTGHGGTTTPGEVSNIANWLNTWAPEPPPVVARNGETIYTENCATCHKLYGYDANGNIDLASMGSTAIGKLASRSRRRSLKRRDRQPDRLARQLGSGPASGRRSHRPGCLRRQLCRLP